MSCECETYSTFVQCESRIDSFPGIILLSVGDNSVGDNSVGDNSVGGNSVGDNSVGDNSVGDNSVGDNSVGGNSVWDNSVGFVFANISAASLLRVISRLILFSFVFVIVRFSRDSVCHLDAQLCGKPLLNLLMLKFSQTNCEDCRR